MQFFKKLKRNGWIALKASGSNISFAHVERRSGAIPAITAWVSQPLDLDADNAVHAFANEHSLSSHHCVAVLNRAEYQLLQVDAVKVPPAEAKQAVRWSIKDMLDYPVANATVDVLEIPFDSVNPSWPRFMLAIAARNEVIRERIVRFIDSAPTGLEAIDIAETGQRNIAALLEQKGSGLALLSFNDEGSLLTFTAGGELYYSRQFNITAEQLQTKDEDLRSDLYERVALDLQRTLDHFEQKFSYAAVNRLLVAPFGMRAGLVDFLKSYLSLQVDTFELSDIFNVESVPQLADVALQSRAFTLLGVALREGAHEQQINLLSPALLTSKEWLNARMMAMLAGVTIMLMVATYGWTSYRVTQLAHEQQAVTQALASLKQQLDISIQQHVPRARSPALQDNVAMAEMTLKEHQQVQAFLQGGVFGNAQGFSGYMAAFARQSMKGLWLTDFSIDDSVSKIKISGRALRPDLVGQYISGLRQEPILSGREFAALEMSAVAQPPLAANAMPVPGNLPAPGIPPSIIEFKLQSQEKNSD